VALSGNNSNQFEIVSGGGNFSLSANQEKTIVVKFCPNSTGDKNASLDANGTGVTNNNSADLSGIGTAEPSPTISVYPNSLTFGNVTVGESSKDDYQLTGSNLDANITVSAPSGFQVSLQQNSGFASQITVSHSGGSVDQTIYVKFSPSAAQPYSSNVSNASTGATTIDVSVNGSGIISEVYFLDAMPGQILIDAPLGSNNQMNISSNDEWLIQNQPFWLSVNPLSGSGNESVTLTAINENNTSVERSANLSITSSNAGSKIVMVSQLPYIGINETTSQDDLVLKPNPTTGEVTIIPDCNQSYDLLIYNSLGDLILTYKNIENEKTINLSYLPKGLYTIKVTCNNNMKIKKLIKI
jgi:hypothetical protein